MVGTISYVRSFTRIVSCIPAVHVIYRQYLRTATDVGNVDFIHFGYLMNGNAVEQPFDEYRHIAG